MRFSLTQKATLLIALNLLVTALVFLGFRAYVLHIEDTRGENRLEQFELERFQSALDGYQRFLQSEINGVVRLAERNPQLISSIIDDYGFDGADFVFTVTGDEGVVHYRYPRELTPRGTLAITTQLAQKLEPALLEIGEASGLQRIADEPLLVAGRTFNGAQGQVTLVVALRIRERILPRLQALFNIEVSTIDRAEWLIQSAKVGATDNQFRSSGQGYLQLVSNEGEPVLWLQSRLPVDVVGQAVFSPLLMIILGFAFAVWAGAMWIISRAFLRPLGNIINRLATIRERDDYSQRIEETGSDELSDLVDECNALLSHVQSHTKELRERSYADALTRLGNRRLFEEKLETYWALAIRSRQMVSCAHFDLDFFKQFNDTYGHQAGDQLLQDFADCLRRVFVRESDVVCRTGGDEFFVLAFDTPAPAMLNLANRSLDMLKQLDVAHIEGIESGIASASAGVACMVPNAGQDSAQLIKEADQALYQSKRNGRSRANTYTRGITGNFAEQNVS